MQLSKCLYVLIVSTCWAVAGTAAETRADETTKSCLPLWSIENIKILNNRNIAFHMKNGDYYLSRLPQACPNLDDRRAIMYSTPLTSLCSPDIITVLDNIGGGFRSMGSCGLGKFQPVTEAEIQQLQVEQPAK